MTLEKSYRKPNEISMKLIEKLETFYEAFVSAQKHSRWPHLRDEISGNFIEREAGIDTHNQFHFHCVCGVNCILSDPASLSIRQN